ncbi:ABC-three component system protein [Clostridium botulinum]|uniref:ABC-three component systems C-terminal domain-containing protein n=1 Tax=Clostridium botulinum (strain Langeland / NCTC 10281 / Type F) TaxID=441772 RepID=A7GEF4_CLOBL|nr:ABC-three component system protein [Clostridium botulinum]ABS42290.1 hypothetical protein CLI_1906 [Clostridium botulinum F str. Langeland]KKM42840.1 hypothetical protein VT72_04155 [Clostridium botulinum]MBY6791640.1 hypothetical protein [Clostridium botulinum]MBY6936876.1 hypothetical protein [Clostridium botulinum]MBY6944296.1 hypothetical protein [Clostridium botulinum]
MFQRSMGSYSPNIKSERDTYSNCSFFGAGDIPINIDANEIKKLIDIFFQAREEFKNVIKRRLTDSQIKEEENKEIKRTNIELKNKINNISQDYYKNVIRCRIPYFNEIKDYLGDSENENENERYIYISETINESLIAYKKEFPEFDKALDYLIKKSIELIEVKFGDLSISEKNMIKIIIAYMYYYCDLGENYEDKTK